MSKTKKIISMLVVAALIMTMATVAIVSTSAAAKVYFEDSLNWGNIYAYCYGGDGEVLGGWGGTACTDEGNGIWSVEVTGTPSHIIFHANDDANQTSDIPFAGDGMIAKLTGDWEQGAYKMVATAEFVAYEGGSDTPAPEVTTKAEVETPATGDTITVYFTNNWAFTTQNIYWWKGAENCGEWPGVAMTAVGQNDGGEDVYSAEIPADAEGIIFSGISDVDGTTLRQTVDITSFADGKGFYCVEEVTGDDGSVKITVESFDYNSGNNNDDVTTQATTTQAASEDEPVELEGTGIVVDGTTYEVPVGTTVTYYVDVTAARLFENIQAYVSYDSTKLELIRIASEDADLADWEVEGPVRCPNLDGVVFNAGADGLVKFNATKIAGYDFTNETNLVTLEFVVNDTAKNEIAIVIEEMTVKGDGTESYFTGGQAAITEGINVVEYLDYEITTTTEEVITTTTPDEITTTVTTTEEITTVTTTAEQTTTTIPTETTTTTIPGPTTNPPIVTGTTPSGTVVAPPTGAAAYIYIAVAIMAMVACAVVVLRKKAND